MLHRQPNANHHRRRSALVAVVASTITVGGLVHAGASDLMGATSAVDGVGFAATGLEASTLPDPIHVDGDFVVFGGPGPDTHVGHDEQDEHDAAQYEAKGAAAGAGGQVRHQGFSTYGDATAIERYEIRLIESQGIEAYRPVLELAASEVVANGGPTVTVHPGTFAPGTPTTRGYIDIAVSSYSPCAGMWLGCGGPTIEGGEVVWGHSWFNPRLATRTPNEIGNTVRHELGHTLGLGHYEYAHEDRAQIMHPTRFDADGYESGDAAGLRFLSGSPAPPPAPAPPAPPPTTTPAPPTPPAPQEVDPVGAIDSAGSGPFGLVVRGWAEDPDVLAPVTIQVSVDGQTQEATADREREGDQNGFEVVHLAPPGTYEVCVLARNAGAGSDRSLGCWQVTVSQNSVGQVGVQTV